VLVGRDKIRSMQSILTDIAEFFIREARTFVAIGLFIGIMYVWDRLSRREQYYRWLIRINPRNAQAHYHLGKFLEDFPDRQTEAESEFRQAISLHSGNSWAYYALYYLQANQKKYSDAQDTLEEMVKRFPQDGVTFACQANLFWRQGLYQEAESAFKDAVRLTPNYLYIRFEYGKFLGSRARYSEAETEFRAALNIQPSDADAYMGLGIALAGLQRLPQAEAAYKKAIKLGGPDNEIYTSLWNLFERSGRFVDAETYFKKETIRHPKNPRLLSLLYSSLAKQGRIEEAELYAEQLLKLDSKDVDSVRDIAIALESIDKKQSAEDLFRRAIARDPENAVSHKCLGFFLHDLDGRLSEAVDVYRKALELDPTDASIYHNLGLALRELKCDEEAESAFRKGIEADPLHASLYRGVGLLLNDRNQKRKAEQYYRKAIEVNPIYTEAYFSLGGLLAEQKRYKEAEDIFRRSISIDAKYIPSYGSFAMLLQGIGRLNDALEVILQALEISPNEFRVNIAVASIQKSLGNMEEARKSVERCRQLIDVTQIDYWYDLACMEAIVDNKELAFQHLRKSAEEQQLDQAWAWDDPDLELLRSDPRFVEIVGPKPEEKNPEA